MTHECYMTNLHLAADVLCLLKAGSGCSVQHVPLLLIEECFVHLAAARGVALIAWVHPMPKSAHLSIVHVWQVAARRLVPLQLGRGSIARLCCACLNHQQALQEHVESHVLHALLTGIGPTCRPRGGDEMAPRCGHRSPCRGSRREVAGPKATCRHGEAGECNQDGTDNSKKGASLQDG